MTTPSNLYAEKIFAEHPTAFWAMDGEADYLSLITEGQRAISSWTASGATATTNTSDLNQPFPNSNKSLIGLSSAPGSSGEYTFTSENLFNLNQLNSLFTSISSGMHYRVLDDNVDYIEFGFKYNDEPFITQIATPNKNGEWQFISNTINISTATSRNVQLIIKVGYTSHVSQKAEVFINGIGVGVWSEEFLKTSLGQSAVTIPTEVSSKIVATQGVPIASYGDTNKTGYYIIDKKTLLARNTSIPMVYGAENSTCLLRSTYPSIVIPGQGIMHNNGRKESRTLEFWLRTSQNVQASVNSGTFDKIFGSISGADGLYMSQGSLMLQIGEYRKKYFVGELARPMLIHIISQKNNYSMLVNGEKVLSLDIDSDSLTLDKDNPDWIGFYGITSSNTTHSTCEVDNIAIYPYIVPEIVAKRRFVYGQGVEYPLSVNSSYNGKSIFIDYRFAEYSNNYSYPNIGRWAQGTYDNMFPLDNALSVPEYSLPTFRVSPSSTNTAQEWLNYHARGWSSSDYQFNAFYFEPPGFDLSGESTEPQIYIEKLSSLINERVDSITAAIFPIDIDPPAEDRLLFKVLNKKRNKSISFFAQQSDRVICKIMSGNTVDETLEVFAAPSSGYWEAPFLVGFQISKISEYSETASAIFENLDDCSVYIGSDENFNNFCGNVVLFSFGASTQRNTQKYFSDKTLSSGLIAGLEDETYSPIWNYSSYKLVMQSAGPSNSVFDNAKIPDVLVTGYWEDYVPLSVLAKEVYTDSGNTEKILDLDFIQFNIESPGVEYVYASFQYLSDGANKPQASLVEKYTETSSVILPDSISETYSGWEDSRFLVSDGAIIYIPKEDGDSNTVDLDKLAIVIHVEVKNVGVLYNPDIRISSLQLSSQALNHNSLNSVNTLFSEKIYPYVSGSTKPYKAQNPFRIYKSSTPYLYLSGKTGIGLAGHGMTGLDLGGGSERFLNIPLTKSGNVSSMQMAVRTEGISTTETKIFDLKTSSGTISFYLDALDTNGDRGIVYAKKNGSDYFYDSNGIQLIEYHLNGKEVKNPILTRNQWDMLGITFPKPLVLDTQSSLNLTGPLLFNNISYYQVDTTKLNDQIVYKLWSDIDNLYWDDVDAKTWQENLVSSETAIVSIDPSAAYSVYLGTNKIIADTYDASSPVLRTQNYEYLVYKDIKWQSQIILPT